MSLRKSTSRASFRTDAFSPSDTLLFPQLINRWMHDFQTLKQSPLAWEDFMDLVCFNEEFPQMEIDASYFECCVAQGLLAPGIEGCDLTEKGEAFILFAQEENKMLSIMA